MLGRWLRAQAHKTDIPGLKPYFHHSLWSWVSFFSSCFVTNMNASGWGVVFEHRTKDDAFANVKPGMITEHAVVFAGSKQSS